MSGRFCGASPGTWQAKCTDAKRPAGGFPHGRSGSSPWDREPNAAGSGRHRPAAYCRWHSDQLHYAGGSEPGTISSVLPTLLICLDYLSYFEYRVEYPADIPEASDMPIYLLGWCQTRHAARTFSLDLMATCKTADA